MLMTLNLVAVHHLTNDSPDYFAPKRHTATFRTKKAALNLLNSQWIHLTVFPISNRLARNLKRHVLLSGVSQSHGKMRSVCYWRKLLRCQLFRNWPEISVGLPATNMHKPICRYNWSHATAFVKVNEVLIHVGQITVTLLCSLTK